MAVVGLCDDGHIVPGKNATSSSVSHEETQGSASAASTFVGLSLFWEVFLLL